MSLQGYKVNDEGRVPYEALIGEDTVRHVGVNSLGHLIAASDPQTIALFQAMLQALLNMEIDVDSIDLSNSELVVNTQQIEDNLGDVNANNKEQDPDAASGALNDFIRGMFEAQGVLGSTKITDPDAAAASLASLLRGILEAVNTGKVGSAPQASVDGMANPGESSDVFDSSQNLNHTFDFDITTLGTSTEIVVRVEGSNDGGTSWFNLDALGEDSVYTTTGRKMLNKMNFSVAQVRITFVSEDGTGGNIATPYYTGN
ncbi:MAG: hypothetical protein JRJ68_03265 [Deltaproteobacteria bacterium]|nr:hypothetical protein [Deltaproteobacteria bacterium]